MATTPPKPTIMGSLGAFVGHIVKAVRTDTETGERQEVARTTEERHEGNVTLRRTTIDEVVYEPGAAPTTPDAATDPASAPRTAPNPPAAADAAPTDDSQG